MHKVFKMAMKSEKAVMKAIIKMCTKEVLSVFRMTKHKINAIKIQYEMC